MLFCKRKAITSGRLNSLTQRPLSCLQHFHLTKHSPLLRGCAETSVPLGREAQARPIGQA